MILGVYLIIPIIAGYIKGTKLDGVRYFLIIWLITTAIYTLSKIFGFNLHYLDLVIYSGPIGFLMLGYYLHNKEISMSPKKVVIISLIVFIIFTLIKTFIVNQYLDISFTFRYFIFTVKSHLENDTVSIIQVAALFLIVKYIPMVKSGICQKITEFCNKKSTLSWIISISQASYGIYLCHYFITLSFKKILKIYCIQFSSLPSIVVVPLLTISVLLLAYAMIMILNKVQVINKLTGYH